MVGYTTYLRKLTKGEGNFVMNFSHYERVSGAKQEDILGNPFNF
jgi:translation elongation factor EF-G